MKIHNRMACALVFLTMPVVSAGADEDQGQGNLSVYRGSSGELTKNSVENAKSMRRIARKKGYVTLFVTVDVEFEPYLDGLTATEIVAQQTRATAKLTEVLAPLVDAGVVWHGRTGPLVQGPGCLIRANAKGVARLVRDRRVLHIVARDL